LILIRRASQIYYTRSQFERFAIENKRKGRFEKFLDKFRCSVSFSYMLTRLFCMHRNRLNKRDLEYAALEDEFRMGLQIEANRFREVGTANIVLIFRRLSN